MRKSATIIGFIENKFKKNIDINTKLLEDQIIDSLGFFDLVTFIEQKFNISLNDKDLNVENFHSVNDIVKMLKEK